MKNRHIYATAAAAGAMLLCFGYPARAQASDGEEYITISVDAVDDNADLKYALDSDAETAFTDSNEFTVPAGTSHTIYVKDAAGNITSQRYEPEEDKLSADYSYDIYENEDGEEDEQQINIDLELGRKNEEEETLPEETGSPGTASVLSRTKTDGTVDAEKVFYTFSTKEGEELYLIVDQGRGSDNVYLLDTVSLGDLRVLADNQDSAAYATSEGKEDNLLSILAADNADDGMEGVQTPPKKKSSFGSNLAVLFLALIGGGAYYYLKIYRNKKDEAMDVLDAMDMDEFEPEEEEGEIEFDYDEAEKERYLEALINEEEEAEELYDINPDEYAAIHAEEGGTPEDLMTEEETGFHAEDGEDDPYDGVEIEF